MYIYYVYAYLRENNTPYYIGKGKGNRAFKKHGKLPVPKDKSKIVFIFQDLIEQDAHELECLLIKFHGRKDNGTGILRNLTDGGEGRSGAIVSDETRKKLQKPKPARSAEHNTNLGKSLSVALKGRPKPPRSAEHKRAISAAMKGKKQSPEAIEKRFASRRNKSQKA